MIPAILDDGRLQNRRPIDEVVRIFEDRLIENRRIAESDVRRRRVVAGDPEQGQQFHPFSKINIPERAVAVVMHEIERRTVRCWAFLGAAYHQSGNRPESLKCFEELEAESKMNASRTMIAALHCVRGFFHVDLLLDEAERASWARLSPLTGHSDEGQHQIREDIRKAKSLAEEWREVARRAGSAAHEAVSDLNTARAIFYHAILKQDRGPDGLAELAEAERTLGSVFTNLRSTEHWLYVPNALLTRAWIRSLTSALAGPDSAQSDLDEAWEIAERGPMPLFLADIHLHRVRLFFREAAYPWESPQHDLKEARRLIFKHGYLRRQEELEDAEAVILG